MYFILDFSKLIHQLLVKYNITESTISKSLVSVLSQLVLHRDNTNEILHLQYIILHLAKVHANIILKNESVGVLLHLQAKKPSIYLLSFELYL